MKYKVGDKVQIKSIDWYNENKGPFGEICPDFIVFLPSRSKYCGQIMTIKEVLRNSYNSDLIYYKMIEDSQLNDWTDGMIEGLVDEETPKFKVNDLKYPKTYEECCEILGIGSYFEPEIRNVTTEECHKFEKLIRLKRCRDAYWEFYGEEIELGKPWEPNRHGDKKYTIEYYDGAIIRASSLLDNRILAFPIEEMRDAFYENFKDLIEQCKELL